MDDKCNSQFQHKNCLHVLIDLFKPFDQSYEVCIKFITELELRIKTFSRFDSD